MDFQRFIDNGRKKRKMLKNFQVLKNSKGWSDVDIDGYYFTGLYRGKKVSVMGDVLYHMHFNKGIRTTVVVLRDESDISKNTILDSEIQRILLGMNSPQKAKLIVDAKSVNYVEGDSIDDLGRLLRIIDTLCDFTDKFGGLKES
ncbi:MAG: hypothetical protein V1875_03640 [Candidatus Altiarchaeota archaeon]